MLLFPRLKYLSFNVCRLKTQGRTPSPVLGCIVSNAKQPSMQLDRNIVPLMCEPTLNAVQARVKFHVLLTSYETALSEATELRRLKWETLVVDEGHRLKNKNSRLFTVSLSLNNPLSTPERLCMLCTQERSDLLQDIALTSCWTLSIAVIMTSLLPAFEPSNSKVSSEEAMCNVVHIWRCATEQHSRCGAYSLQISHFQSLAILQLTWLHTSFHLTGSHGSAGQAASAADGDAAAEQHRRALHAAAFPGQRQVWRPGGLRGPVQGPQPA